VDTEFGDLLVCTDPQRCRRAPRHRNLSVEIGVLPGPQELAYILAI